MNQLDQLKTLCDSALSLCSTKVRKNFKTFFIQTMLIYATTFIRINFSQMGRLSSSCEQRYRQNFEKKFNWIAFNKFFLSMLPMRRCAIALDPNFISKSGKHTPGLAYFWSGTAGTIKRGLEILGFAVVDADSNDAIFMCAKQTRADKGDKGRRPDCLKWCKGNSSLIEQYLRAIHSNKTEFLKTSNLFVADAFFSVYPFVEGLATMGFNIEGKKTQTRKMFFSTDTTMEAIDIFDIYRARFQEEFLFRNAKGFMGLEHCQARSEKKLDFAFNMSLATVKMVKYMAHRMEIEKNIKLSVQDMKIMFCALIKGLTNLKFFQSMPHSRATLYLIYIGQPSSSDV